MNNYLIEFPRGPWTPRRLSDFISDCRDDIEFSQTQIKKTKKNLADIADSKKEVQQLEDDCRENGWRGTLYPGKRNYTADGEPDFSLMREKMDENFARFESLIRDHEVMMEHRRRLAKQAEELLRQMSD